MIEPAVYFNNLIASDPNLKQYENDFGIQLLGKSLEFKIQEALATHNSNTNELYSPSSEIVLLSKMLYEMAYLKFKKPLIVSADITSSVDTPLPKESRFTDGENLFYLNEHQTLTANVATNAIMTLQKMYKKTVTIEKANLYYKIPLNITYRDMVSASVFVGGKELRYSQNFIHADSECSYEVTHDGLVQIVILLGNTLANNLSNGVSLDVTTITTPDDVELPTGITIIESGYDIGVTNISTVSNSEPYMSTEDMKDYLRFGRKNIGDLILNEDFKQLLLRNVAGIQELKVWQESDEEKEVGPDLSHINKVFVSYIPDVEGQSLNASITSTIQTTVYGRECVIKAPIIVDLSVSINLSSSGSISAELQASVINEVSGYYDDVTNVITTSALYNKVFTILRDVANVNVFISLSYKGLFKNRNFFRITEDNISILVN